MSTETRFVADLALRRSQTDLLKQAAAERTNTTDFNDSGMPVSRKPDHLFLKEKAFRAFALHHRLQALVSQLIRNPPLMTVDQIFMKRPQIGSGKPWHQDNPGFRVSRPIKLSRSGLLSTTLINQTVAPVTLMVRTMIRC